MNRLRRIIGIPATATPRAGILLAILTCATLAPGVRAQEEGAEKEALAAIQKQGGRIERDEESDEKPVVGVNFAVTKVTDSDLEPLTALPQLKKLTLNGTKVTDAGLERLKGLGGLRKLYLVDTEVTDAGLEHLKGLSELQVLSVVGTQVSDDGLEHLKGLANLRELFIAATKVTDDGAKAFKEAMPEVKLDR